MSEPTSPVVTIGGVARVMGVTPGAVRRWQRVGLIPEAIRVEPGSRHVYHADDLVVIRERVETKRAAGRQQGDRVPGAN